MVGSWNIKEINSIDGQRGHLRLTKATDTPRTDRAQASSKKMRHSYSGWPWALAAGSAAAISAVVAKFLSPQIPVLLRLGGYSIVILLNVLMWSCYVRSLKILSSLQATVVSFASNFLASGLAGYFCFSESLHFQWFIGALLIILGILFLSSADKQEESQKSD